MTVSELIAELQKLPPDAEVGYVWDGCLRSRVEILWIAKSGEVALSALGEDLFNEDDIPDGVHFDGRFFTATKESIKP